MLLRWNICNSFSCHLLLFKAPWRPSCEGHFYVLAPTMVVLVVVLVAYRHIHDIVNLTFNHARYLKQSII
jgi:hypothetical protein